MVSAMQMIKIQYEMICHLVTTFQWSKKTSLQR